MPCTLKIAVPTAGGANVVSFVPSTYTESDGADESTIRKALVWPRPPVSDVRATLSAFVAVWFSFTRQPSYCSKNVFVGVSLSCVEVPTKNGGSVLPEDTLRTTKFGAPKLLFAASTSVAFWNSETAANSTTIESPIAKL